MSNAGVAKKTDLMGLLRNLFGNNNEEIEENIESFEKIDTKNINVTEKEMEELKKSSSNRLKVLEDRYGIEPKKLNVRKAPKAKIAKIEKKTVSNASKERQDEERER